MKNTWFKLLALSLLSLGSLAVLTVGAQAPSSQPEPPPPAEPVKPAKDQPRIEEPTEEEKKDPDGGFTAAQADQPVEELPPDMRGTADFDISFPIDI
jgi:hypothetical protein